MARAGAPALIIAAVFVLAPLAIQSHVAFKLNLLSFHIVATAPAVCRKGAGFVTAYRTGS